MSNIPAEETKYGRCQATAKSSGERCGRPAIGEHGKCGYHGGKTPTKDENPDVGAPEGHFNALDTGDNVIADRWIEYVEKHADDDLEDIFKANFERFRDRGAEPAVATRMAVLRSKADFNHMELIKEDFMTPFYHEGEYVDDVFDSERDSSALANEREARLGRREDKLSPYSTDSDMADGLENIADVISDIQDS